MSTGTRAGIVIMPKPEMKAEPEDAAAMICFLLSDQASWVTGQVFSVNGGFVMP